MAHLSLRCVEMVEVATDWMEGVLSDDERVLVEEHIAICPQCSDYVAQLRTASGVLREAPREVPPATARAALLDAFRHHAG